MQWYGYNRKSLELKDFERLSKPHKWFAWYPVWVSENKRAWLEFVTRRYEGMEWYSDDYRIRWGLRDYYDKGYVVYESRKNLLV